MSGDDRDLARVVQAHPGGRIHFRPTDGSDLARVVGLAPGGMMSADELPVPSITELVLDAVQVEAGSTVHLAVNMVVLGVAPDRQRWGSRRFHATITVDGRVLHQGRVLGVVVANGQFLRGGDVVPRGHPGDGRIEVQAYALARAQRAPMRARLTHGDHVPHPSIRAGAGTFVEIETRGPAPLEIDGHPGAAVTSIRCRVAPGAFSLLV